MTLLFASLFFRLMFQELGGADQAAAWLSDIPGGKVGFVDGGDDRGVPARHQPRVPGDHVHRGAHLRARPSRPSQFTEQEIVWFAVLMAVNLNMAFISPPVGFSLFYLQSVAPPEVKTADIHKGALPFMGLQIVALFDARRCCLPSPTSPTASSTPTPPTPSAPGPTPAAFWPLVVMGGILLAFIVATAVAGSLRDSSDGAAGGAELAATTGLRLSSPFGQTTDNTTITRQTWESIT